MKFGLPQSPSWFSISGVERETGLGKDTLRVWERRYGFPSPHRDAQGERAYPPEQIERLRLLKRLLDAGHRPGQVVPLDIEQLHRLSREQPAITPALDERPDLGLHRWVELLQAHDLEALRRRLSEAQQRMGLAAFIDRLLVPLNTLVGDAWMRGSIEVYHEHVFSEIQQTVLRAGLAGLEDPGLAHPRVLLATLPGEPHWLGLLMAEALLTIDGARCISLGAQAPLWDISQAAERFGCHIVGIGFSSYMTADRIIAGVTELRRLLPARIDLWAGGTAPALKRRVVAGVTPVPELSGLHAALRSWHATAR